jgi:nitroreductase
MKTSLLEIIKKRKSERSYLDKDVEGKKLDYIIEAFRLAPSAGNKQPWKLLIIKDKETINKISGTCFFKNPKWLNQAPVLIICCTYPEESYEKIGGYVNSHQIDLGIAFEHLILAAAEQDLGTCWIGAFDESEIKKILEIPAEVSILAFTPVGYPDRKSPGRGRKSASEIVCFEKYSR